MNSYIHNCECYPFLENLPDKSVDLVLTDPPYDFEYVAKRDYHQQFQRVCRGSIIVFSPPENQWILPADQYLFWTKPISTKNICKSYSRFVEMIFIYGRGSWNNNRHWSNYVNVFPDYVDDASEHPFRKPLSLLTRLILNHSNIGDIVLDPFAGSGATLEAAKMNGRKYIGCEKDPDYFQIAQNHLVKGLSS